MENQNQQQEFEKEREEFNKNKPQDTQETINKVEKTEILDI